MGKKDFKIGEVIRMKNAYFGEPAYKIVGVDDYGIQAEWTSSRHGPAGYNGRSVSLISWGELEGENLDWGVYKKCSLVTRLYLFILGNTIGRFRW